MSLDRFIVNYPIRSDNNFGAKMGAKKEFRELLENPNADNPDDPFFRNYQMLIGRWWSPFTNNKIGCIRWDPGVGKTRGGLIFSQFWRKYSSHKKTLVLATSTIITRALEEEVARYNKFDVELDTKKYTQGPRGDGKIKARAKRVKKHGFVKNTVTKLMNEQKRMVGLIALKGSKKKTDEDDIKIKETNLTNQEREQRLEQMRKRIRSTYKDYIIIVDEAHLYRATRFAKQGYNDLLFFIDSIRDICPILFLTATPIVDTWKDLFSLIGLMLDPKSRQEMEEQISQIDAKNLLDVSEIEINNLIGKYAYGLFSDRDATGIVPHKINIPRDGYKNIKYQISSDDVTMDLRSDLYPVFMSDYQTRICMIKEGSDIVKKGKDILSDDTMSKLEEKGSFHNILRQHYDFTPPYIDGNPMSIEELIVERDKKFYPSSNAILIRKDISATKQSMESDMIFHVYMNDNIIDTTRGMGKYSAKYAELYRLLMYQPELQNIPGYVHTLWVEYGTKPIAAMLNEMGWEQYTGTESVSSTNPNRFAVIHGSVKEVQITKILEAFSSEKNRDGSILRLIIGSKKTGISISLPTAQFFIEMSSDYNENSNIQAEGRVFRTNSLNWIPNPKDRKVYTANMVSLPSIPSEFEEEREQYIKDVMEHGFIENKSYLNIKSNEENVEREYSISPLTLEINMYYLSSKKSDMSKIAMKKIKEVSIESIILSNMDTPIDTSTCHLLYSSVEKAITKSKISKSISDNWFYQMNPQNMLDMRAVSELISDHSLTMTKYGLPRPIQSYGSVITAYFGNPLKSQDQFSLIYDRNFFVLKENKVYSKRSIDTAIDLLLSAPNDEFDFNRFMCREHLLDNKIIALEVALATPQKLISVSKIKVFNAKRKLLLSLFQDFWQTFSKNTMVHILWYGIKDNSHLTKIGINATPRLKTRQLLYENNVAESNWKYIDTIQKETLYLSVMSKNLLDKENEIIKNSEKYGYYIHFSIFDSEMKLKKIVTKDKRKVSSYAVGSPEVKEITEKILGKKIDNIELEDLRRELYYKGKELGIMMIR